MFKAIIKRLPLALLLFSCNVTHAYIQDEKLWLAINSQFNLTQDHKWHGLIYTQARLINQSHPMQAGLIEGAVGYLLFPEYTVWFGYRWTGRNPNNGFSQENRLVQQMIHVTKLNNLHILISRLRLEEIELSNQNQIALQLRYRLGFQNREQIVAHTFPFIYDESFFRLNKTSYTSRTFFSENRAFIGANIYVNKRNWWEVGYINQYIRKTQLISDNCMYHILSITYNFT